MDSSSRRLHLGGRVLLSLELSHHLAVAALTSSHFLHAGGRVLALNRKPSALGLSTIVVLHARLV